MLQFVHPFPKDILQQKRKMGNELLVTFTPTDIVQIKTVQTKAVMHIVMYFKGGHRSVIISIFKGFGVWSVFDI